jgi:hypothetical protein
VPNLEILYQADVDADLVDTVLSEQDNFIDRRNRVLDSMLALYGEVFPEQALRRFDVYYADDFGRHLINCKIGVLRHLCDLSARRAQAMSVRSSYWQGLNYSPIQLRVQLLSGGSEALVGKSLAAALHNLDVRLISDARYEQKLQRAPVTEATVGLPWPAQPAAGKVLGSMPLAAVSPSLLRAGVHKENYVTLADGEHSWLCLNLDEKRCWPLLHLPNAELAAGARDLRDMLVSLNQASEGFHLLEHVLLRPRAIGATHAVAEDFYAHRVSVILPSFTARFSDPACRAWMEELIAHQLPAHILPTFYWLDYAFLALFERRYRVWLDLLNESNSMSKLDEAAAAVIALLDKVSQYHTNRHWM